jgi:hypothetical protein
MKIIAPKHNQEKESKGNLDNFSCEKWKQKRSKKKEVEHYNLIESTWSVIKWNLTCVDDDNEKPRMTMPLQTQK